MKKYLTHKVLKSGNRVRITLVDSKDEKSYVDVSPKNLEKYLIKMNQICSNREKIMARHAGKTTWTQDIIANFDHNFWNGMGDHKVKAARLWGHV